MDCSGLLSVTVTKPETRALLRARDMEHARLQIIAVHQDSMVDTSFSIGTSVIGPKTVRRVPVGRNVAITANIYSQDDTLTHSGTAIADVLAADTTHVTIATSVFFGYLDITIYEVPSNVDSGYVKISASDMADLYCALSIDSLARDTAVEYDGHATGLVEYIPVGANRRIEIVLLKSNGEIAYDGSVVMEIEADNNTIGTITLDPGAARIRVSVVEPDFDTVQVVASALEEGRVETGELLLTEIMYNSTGADNNEWIELFNTSAAALDLSGYGLVVEDDTFSLSGTLPAGERHVAGESDSAYIDIKLSGFNIPNSGETSLSLFRTADDSTSDRLRLKYKAGEGWPTSASGVAVALNSAYLDAASNNYGVFWSKVTDTIAGSDPVELGTPGF